MAIQTHPGSQTDTPMGIRRMNIRYFDGGDGGGDGVGHLNQALFIGNHQSLH